MKTYQKVMYLLAVLSVSMVQVACRPKTAVAPASDPLLSTELKEFPAESLRLANVKFFMWKKDLTGSDVSTVSQLAREIDALDVRGAPLSGMKLKAIKERDDSAPVFDDQLIVVKRRIRTANSAIKKLKSKITKEEQKAPEEQDVTSLTQWKAELAISEKEATDAEAEKSQLEADRAKLDLEVIRIDQEQVEVQKRGQEALSQIMNLVDWYKNQPKSVSVQFAAGEPVLAEIVDWDLSDGKGPRLFSSDSEKSQLNRIEDIKYRTRGGLFTFKAVVYMEAPKSFSDANRLIAVNTYCFKFARTKYEESLQDGKVYFAGDLVQEEGASVCDWEALKKSTTARKGVVKLVDKTN